MNKKAFSDSLSDFFNATTKRYDLARLLPATFSKCTLDDKAHFKGQRSLNKAIDIWNKANPDKPQVVRYEFQNMELNALSLYTFFKGIVFGTSSKLFVPNMEAIIKYDRKEIMETIVGHVMVHADAYPYEEDKYRTKVGISFRKPKVGKVKAQKKELAAEEFSHIAVTMPTLEEITPIIAAFDPDAYPVYSIGELKAPFIEECKGAKLPKGFRGKVLKSTMAQIYRHMEKNNIPFKKYSFLTFYGESDDADEEDVSTVSEHSTSLCFFHDTETLKMAAYTLLNQMTINGANARLICKVADRFEKLHLTVEHKKYVAKDKTHNLKLTKAPVIEEQQNLSL